MKKLIQRVMAFSLSFLLAINTASAGRWFQGCLCPPVDVCPPMACGPVDCGPTYSCNVDCGMSYYGGWEAAAVYQPTCGGCSGGGCSDCGSASIESSDCGCDGTAVMESSVDSQPTYSEPTYSEPAYEAPAPSVVPALPTPVEQPVAPVDAFSDTPEVVAEPADLFEEVPAEEPAAFNEPSDDLFDDVMVEDEVAVGDEVAFGEEPMDAFEDDTFEDDAFGEEGFASEQVVEEDDLFGEESADELMEEPADELIETPADDAADDLFGDEPMDDFAADELEEEAASGEGFDNDETPAFGDETPAFGEEALADDAGDLFGEEPVDEFADDADDLFGEESADDAGDLFGEEADDFGGADDFAPVEETPADEAVPAEDPSDEDAFDDLFGSLGAILQEPGGYFAITTRTWVDNTGTFSCVGRLVTVEGSNVRLRKTNGTTTIVPLGRLSSRDLEFVNRQASAQYEVELIRTAQR